MWSSISSIVLQIAQIPAILTTLGLNGILWPSQTTLTNNSSYDYIVIGAGSAGSVVATRLVEDKSNSVLLLEAGGNPPLTALLAGLFVTLPKSEVDYDYASTYNPYSAGAQGNYTTLTAGKMLGGSDSLNHLLHTRGCKNDYNDWAKIVGDDSWNYESMLQYFKKSERVDDDEILEAYPTYHGTTGPMGLSTQRSNKATKYLKAFEEVGHPTLLDINANVSIGYTEPLYMIADSIRQTPAKSYLGKVKDYPNLFVSKNTRAVRIIFEDSVAKAVEAIYDGKTYILRANKEIILSAGAFGSPQVLMLSGIGPKDHLEEMGIEVKSNLPVGETFKDQVATSLIFTTDKALFPIANPSDLATSPTKMSFPVIVGSVALNNSDTCADYQSYGLILSHDTPFLTLVCHDVFWFREDICDDLQSKATQRDTLYTVIAKTKPRSNGTIRLNSSDPFDAPIITTGFLAEEDDLKDMVKYVKDYIKVKNSSYFQKVSAELIGLDLEECANEESDSDAFWECYILNRVGSPYHYSSTCPMGTVVDNKLKVIGFENLRVIDASIMPEPISSAPNAAVIAIAEKGADLVKNESYY